VWDTTATSESTAESMGPPDTLMSQPRIEPAAPEPPP
jgi:hypothetical protein